VTRLLFLVVVASALAGCALDREVIPDPATVPGGSIEALGDDATGPVIEVGSGSTSGIGWRYAIEVRDAPATGQ
jgi:hypothetical protein